MAQSMQEERKDYDNKEEDMETSEWYGVREATLFLVDATQKMCEIDSEIKRSYIQEFFKLYKQILRQKLAWGMQDWMGVMLFGTEEYNTDLTWKHIQILQELKVINLDNLQQIRKLTKSGIKDYQSMQSDDVYPLHDALSYAMEIFLKTKTVFTERRIIIITCHNPELADDEKHRIRLRAASLKDLNIELHVIGIKKNWIQDPFYKDLEILSRKTDLDIHRISLVDLMQQIKAPAKNIARLCFKIYDDVELDVVVRTLSSKRRYLKKKSLSKATNEVLTRSTYFRDEDSNNEENDSDNDEIGLPHMIPDEVNLEIKNLIGGRRLYFTQKEIPQLKLLHHSAIKLICIKSTPDDLFKYHIKPNNFVRPDHNSTRKDNLLLFAALLKKCAAMKKMIVCSVTLRANTQINLCYMIPDTELGGFYLLQVPYQENIVAQSEVLQHYETQNQITDKEVNLWKKAIDQLNINYNPYMFKYYPLECEIQLVEKLALDKNPGPLPIDTVEESFLKAYEKTKKLVHEFKSMYPTDDSGNPPKAKKIKKSKAAS